MNVIFLLLDCLRSDFFMGDRGSSQTPVFRKLQKQGTSFASTIASTTTTTPNVASIFTGLYPVGHGVRSLPSERLSKSHATLPEVFKKNGYHTYAEVTEHLEAAGLDRGFDSYNHRDTKQTIHSQWGNDLVRRLRNGELKEPYFLFVHLFGLHVPRAVPRAFRSSRFGATQYEKALSALDSAVGRLLPSPRDKTLVVVHGDHGEGVGRPVLGRVSRWYRKMRFMVTGNFKGSSGRTGHGYHVYDFMVRVPTLLVAPGVFPAGLRIDNQVRQIDIFPTLVEALKLEAPLDGIHGRSLMPFLRGEVEDREAICEACGWFLREKSKRKVGIRTPRFKFVFMPYAKDPREELFDLSEDPDERRNVVRHRPEIASALRSRLEQLMGSYGET